MRPKKRILLAACHEERASVMKYVFETNGFVATIASDATQAAAELRAKGCDLLLCELPFDGVQGVLDMARAAYTPSAVLTGALRSPAEWPCADVTIGKAESLPFILVERVRMLCARKRGPRRGAKVPPATVAPLDAQKARLA